MRNVVASLCALAVWVSAAMPAAAAWNNVFQPTLFGRLHRQNTTSQYTAPAVVYSAPVAAPVASSCQPSCSTSYTQRCYYQPITTYQSQSYYEPVTTYQTSYYYEPVTSYRYSCYYDPCSCNYQQVATPVTSYQLRAKSCPVQSWVQRCAQVPVTSYQKACYWQPQTTCCQTTEGAPIMNPPAMTGPPAVSAIPGNPPPGTAPPPVINENRSPTPPNGGGSGQPSYYPPQPSTPPTTPGTSWQPAPVRVPIPNNPPSIPAVNPTVPSVKLERIVFGPDAAVEGQVVRSDNTPRPDAKVLFVSANQPDLRETVTANGAGRFQLNLATGGWLVYVQGVDGSPIFHSRIDVSEQQPARIILVNR